MNWRNDTLEQNIELFENLSTGDEIHFTDGTIWSCVLWHELVVAFTPLSFKQLEELGGYSRERYFPEDVKGVLLDAIKGGAKIVKGAGVKS